MYINEEAVGVYLSAFSGSAELTVAERLFLLTLASRCDKRALVDMSQADIMRVMGYKTVTSVVRLTKSLVDKRQVTFTGGE